MQQQKNKLNLKNNNCSLSHIEYIKIQEIRILKRERECLLLPQNNICLHGRWFLP